MLKFNPNPPKLTDQEIKRFWSYIDQSPGQGPKGECWQWKRAKTSMGYGNFQAQSRQYIAHRLAFFLVTGRWGAICICHHCDNPCCCNPKHLFPGTVKDNVRDMYLKGRAPIGDAHPWRRRPELVLRGEAFLARFPNWIKRGETNYHAKLTNDQVKEIRRLYKAGTCRQAELARQYSVSKQTIWVIIHEKRWKSVL